MMENVKHGTPVLAKFGGYPPWPAVVQRCEAGKVEVRFLGSCDVELMDPSEIQLYSKETRERFVKSICISSLRQHIILTFYKRVNKMILTYFLIVI